MDRTDNLFKYENYREQFRRLKRAMDNGFYLEAVFIEYTVMEDRTESILRHAGLWDAYLRKRGRYDVTLDSKIRYIQNFAREKKSLLFHYFGDSLLDDVLEWKEKRNRLVHALLRQKTEHGEIAGSAEQGKALTEQLRNRASGFRKAIERFDSIDCRDDMLYQQLYFTDSSQATCVDEE